MEERKAMATFTHIWRSGSGQLNSPLSIGRITKFDFHPQIEARFSPLLFCMYSERITDLVAYLILTRKCNGNFGTS